MVSGPGSDLSEEPAVQDVEPITLDFVSLLIVLLGRRSLLESAGVDPSEIGLVIVATVTPDTTVLPDGRFPLLFKLLDAREQTAGQRQVVMGVVVLGLLVQHLLVGVDGAGIVAFTDLGDVFGNVDFRGAGSERRRRAPLGRARAVS